MATRAASLLGFLLFFVTCHAVRDVTQCHAICIFFTGGELTYERGGDARRKFWKTPKGDQPGRGPTFFWPLKETILLQRSLVIDVIENFDYAPITVKPGGGGGSAWGGDVTFFKNLQLNSLPTGKSFQSIATKSAHPGLHIAVKYPKAEPKKGTIKISPNKTLQSLSILRCCITEDTCSCYSCNYMF